MLAPLLFASAASAINFLSQERGINGSIFGWVDLLKWQRQLITGSEMTFFGYTCRFDGSGDPVITGFMPNFVGNHSNLYLSDRLAQIVQGFLGIAPTPKPVSAKVLDFEYSDPPPADCSGFGEGFAQSLCNWLDLNDNLAEFPPEEPFERIAAKVLCSVSCVILLFIFFVIAMLAYFGFWIACPYRCKPKAFGNPEWFTRICFVLGVGAVAVGDIFFFMGTGGPDEIWDTLTNIHYTVDAVLGELEAIAYKYFSVPNGWPKNLGPHWSALEGHVKGFRDAMIGANGELYTAARLTEMLERDIAETIDAFQARVDAANESECGLPFVPQDGWRERAASHGRALRETLGDSLIQIGLIPTTLYKRMNDTFHPYKPYITEPAKPITLAGEPIMDLLARLHREANDSDTTFGQWVDALDAFSNRWMVGLKVWIILIGIVILLVLALDLWSFFAPPNKYTRMVASTAAAIPCATTILVGLTGGLGSILCVAIVWVDAFAPDAANMYFREVYRVAYRGKEVVDLPPISFADIAPGLISRGPIPVRSFNVSSADDPNLTVVTDMLDSVNPLELTWEQLVHGVEEHFPLGQFARNLRDAVNTLVENVTFPNLTDEFVNTSALLRSEGFPANLSDLFGTDVTFAVEQNCSAEIGQLRAEIEARLSEWEYLLSKRAEDTDSLNPKYGGLRIPKRVEETLAPSLNGIANAIVNLLDAIPGAIAGLPVDQLAQLMKFFRSDIFHSLAYLAVCLSVSGYLITIGWVFVTIEMLVRRSTMLDEPPSIPSELQEVEDDLTPSALPSLEPTIRAQFGDVEAEEPDW
jgi:hypothetical protein